MLTDDELAEVDIFGEKKERPVPCPCTTSPLISNKFPPSITFSTENCNQITARSASTARWDLHLRDVDPWCCEAEEERVEAIKGRRNLDLRRSLRAIRLDGAHLPSGVRPDSAEPDLPGIAGAREGPIRQVHCIASKTAARSKRPLMAP
eukprot:766428-Hanusia_phi.AAC.7